MSTDMASKRERLAALITKDRRPGTVDQDQRDTGGQPVRPFLQPEDAAARDEPFPLTRIQQSYLIGRSNEFVLGNVSTHNYFEIEVADLDFPRFQGAWRRLIARHDMLRAVFSEEGSQRILPEVPAYEVALLDLGDDNRISPDAALAALRERMAHQSFRVDAWPLFEVAVARRIDGTYRLHFSIDMLIADAMSTMILIRDLDALYAHPSVDLPELTCSFRSFVEATCAFERSPDHEEARDYWQSRIDSLPSAPELPLAKTPENVENPRFKRREYVLNADRWERCQKNVQQAGITPSAFLITLFSFVLARWGKSNRFCLNLTLLNRPPLHEQIGALVGDFTSLIMLEVDIDPAMSLLENARRTQTQLWRDMSHRSFDGVDVLRLLNRHYGSQQAVTMPIVFTSALGMSGSGRDEATGEFLSTLTRLGADGSYGVAQSSQVWLDHVVRESAGALGVSWDSLEELFPDGLLDDMFDAYCHLLDRVADGRIGLDDIVAMPLPDPQSASRTAVNDTRTEVPDGLLHAPFQAHVAENGSRIAVKSAGYTLSYRELDALARAIADRLHAADGHRSELIAVVMTKGWEQIAAVFGILYYGAAYLPIDANLPPERIELLLDQAGVVTVLTQAAVRDRLPLAFVSQAIIVDRDLADHAGATHVAHRRRTADDIAYVTYTSGSTGIPKGVVIEHLGALNTIVDMNRRFHVGANDKVLAVSSLSFDLSVYDIFGVLGAGGTVVVPDAEKEKDPAHWLSLVEREAVTVWNTVPPLIQLLVEQVEYKGSQSLASLRLVLSSGDWLSPELPGRLSAVSPGAELISLGGATEASIWSIFYPVTTSMEGLGSVPYGKPLANQTFHVLDEALQDKPDFVPGQLYIGGIGLAREYWKDPEKTRHSFIRHPKTGERLYRTGDLGRYLPDGNIEFLGRNDNQVKIRGNRVEMGEIETALRRAEGIQDAVVIADGDKFGRKRLVAYVVSDVAVDSQRGDTGSPAVIADPIERAAFKFERAGLRRIAGAGAIALAVRLQRTDRIHLAFEPRILAKDDAFTRPRPLPLNRLGNWLACLGEIKIEDHAIPKRLYPSAGSTYSLQSYLAIGDASVEDVPAGCYYYDPSGHRLIALDTGGSETIGTLRAGTFELHLIADRAAIAPLYGKYADKFSVIEAGHMQALLSATASCNGVSVAIDEGMDLQDPDHAFMLSANHRPILALRCSAEVDGPATNAAFVSGVLARQSYRKFHAGAFSIDDLQALLAELPTATFDICVTVHDPRDGARKATLHRYDATSRRLVGAGETDVAALRRTQGIENQSTHAEAAFTLYLVKTDIDDATLLEAGRWTQQAMHLGTRHLIGFCPVGNIALAPLRNALPSIGQRLVYGMLGGGITLEQTEQWPIETSTGKADAYQDLRNYLAQSLPDYMIPSVFVTVEKIPLTSNGKLNRAALPAIKQGDAQQHAGYIAPSTPLELTIADLWRQVLTLETVGVHDNFFEVGGDSLSAIRLLSLMRKEFDASGTEMSLRFLFKKPTIRQMADSVSLSEDAALVMKAHASMLQNDAAIVEGEL